MKVKIDRFEGEYAIIELENQKLIQVPKLLIPQDAKEGDVLRIEVAFEETEKRKESIQKMLDSL